ncbi:hypothetical protein M0811_08561 [Anaeramoeba ignava]|uniref:Uncharacterized protein n=1 Tax=Anaeramoeba ignava TaxID=1746090 RepID=A0A9Q0LJ98_ANAIG|nr:hypothetical protein M0811_08561 [Anaeramoeba ignava]
MLTANDGKQNDHFGESISISKDENIILISALAKVGDNYNQGKVYIFQKNENENEWNQIQILTANDGKQNDFFGESISISNDENILLIGAPGAKFGDNYKQGKVYIFQKNKNQNENKWNQIQMLTANDGKENDHFGLSISISKDDNILLIGAPYAKVENNEEQGKVYIFQKNQNENKWNKIQILTANYGKENDHFGFSILISKDENILLIGAPFFNFDSDIEQGKVYIFQKNQNENENKNQNENKWNQIQILTENYGKEYDWFGQSISISNDENILLIGSPYAKVGDNEEQGKAYIFQKNENENKWNQIQILTENYGKENDHFGYSVSISKDGDIILIGAPYAKVGDNYKQGKAYIFQKNQNENKWNQIQILTANDGKENDHFGESISIPNDENIFLISAPYAKVGDNEEQGKVYIFQKNQNENKWNQIQILTANDGKENDLFGFRVSISKDGDIILISASGAKVGNNKEQGKVYVFQKNENENENENKWNQIQILTANDGKENGWFGESISISKDGNILLIGTILLDFQNNIKQGKVYIFQKNQNQNKWNQIQMLSSNNGEEDDLFGFTVLISDNYLVISAPISNSLKGRVYLFNQKQNNSQNQSKIEYDLISEKEL